MIMGYIVAIIGLIAPFFMIRYREQLGDVVGQAEWMKSVGGVHMIIVAVALVIFLLSVAQLTGTMDFLLGPLLQFIPGLNVNPPPAEVIFEEAAS